MLALRQMAETQGRSQSELIRDALQSYTSAANRPHPRGLGTYVGEIHGAERAKDFLRSASKKGRWRR
jgi:ribbon-helix-helix CopG family protein